MRVIGSLECHSPLLANRPKSVRSVRNASLQSWFVIEGNWGARKNAVHCVGDRSALQVPMQCTSSAIAVHFILGWSAQRREWLSSPIGLGDGKEMDGKAFLPKDDLCKLATSVDVHSP